MRFSLVTSGFISVWVILIISTLPVFAADQGESPRVSGGDFPVFHAPDTGGEILRRGSEGSSRGINRSQTGRRTGRATRGLTRMINQESGQEQEVKIPSRMVPLIPETTGLTSKPQPALFWYISDTWPEKMEFRVNEFRAEEPLLDTEIQGPASEGIWRIDLADHNVKLEPETEYEWFLTIVFDAEDRSADYFISGTIRYVKPSDKVSRILKNTPENQRYAVYAEAGYWYDAMDQLSQQIKARPADLMLRKHRAALLEQVNLPKIAAYSMK